MTRKKILNKTELRAAVLAALPDLLPEWLADGEVRDGKYVALNPNREDRNLGSFQIDLETGGWRDYAIDAGGSDAISLHAYLFNGGEYADSFEQLSPRGLLLAEAAETHHPVLAKVAKGLKREHSSKSGAKRLYEAAASLTNQPAIRYLARRGLRPTAAWDRLRASKLPYPAKGLCPVLIAPIDAPDGTLAGVHRTYLQSSGHKLDVADPRRTLGEVRGNAIRLGKVRDELIICEGLEDGLTLHQEFELPVWVACGACFLHSIVIPEQVRSIFIAADNDPAGQKAAYEAADALAVLGRRVRILRPTSGFKDFNDELLGMRHG